MLMSDKSVPDSCCIQDTENCGLGMADPEKELSDVIKVIYTQGCLDKFQEMVTKNVATVGALGVVVALIQVHT